MIDPTRKARRRRFFGRGDIEPLASPDLSTDQWQDPAQAVEQLRLWAEGHTIRTIQWYLKDKAVKRWSSRLLRAAAVVLAAAGGLAPLLRNRVEAGYVLLALAAACIAFDHFFGLSSGWMRDMTTAQALQGRLTRFHLHWAAWQAGEAGLLKSDARDEEPPGGVRHALSMIDSLLSDVVRLTEVETSQWVSDFHTSMAALRGQTGPPTVTSAEPPSEIDGGRPPFPR